MAANTVLFRTRVPAQRLRNAEKILAKLGIKPATHSIYCSQRLKSAKASRSKSRPTREPCFPRKNRAKYGRSFWVSTDPGVREVWLADLGLAAKTRPVLVLASVRQTDARGLVIVAPLASQLRNLRGEVDIGKPRWLTKHSAVNVQGIAGLGKHQFIRRLGVLGESDFGRVKETLRDLIGL